MIDQILVIAFGAERAGRHGRNLPFPWPTGTETTPARRHNGNRGREEGPRWRGENERSTVKIRRRGKRPREGREGRRRGAPDRRASAIGGEGEGGGERRGQARQD